MEGRRRSTDGKSCATFARLGAWLVVFAAFLASGCATVPRSVLSSDPGARLEFMPQVYMKMSGRALSRTLESMSRAEIEVVVGLFSDSAFPGAGSAAFSVSAAAPGSPAKGPVLSPEALMDFARRTTSLAMGFSDIGKASAAAELVAVGDFPPAKLRLAISASGGWKKAGQGYESRFNPLYIRPLEPGVIHLSTRRQESTALSANRAKPLPERFARLIREDLVFFTDSPGRLLPGGASSENEELPFVSIFATAGISGAGNGYLLDFHVQMKDEASARTFRPIVRFLWVAAADRVFGGNIDPVLHPLVQEGDCYVSRGIPLSEEVLKDIVLSAAAGI